jgi:hypothetical protein
MFFGNRRVLLNLPLNPKRNLLKPNQADATDTLGTTEGFTTYGTTISSSAEQVIRGNKSLKIVTAGSESVESAITQSVNVNPSTIYTASHKIIAPLGALMKIELVERNSADGIISASNTPFVGTGNLQNVNVTKQFGPTGVKARIYIATTTTQKITAFVDELQLEKGAKQTPWVIGSG